MNITTMLYNVIETNHNLTSIKLNEHVTKKTIINIRNAIEKAKNKNNLLNLL